MSFEENEQLALEIKRLELENENLRLRLEEASHQKDSKVWIWALIPIIAILGGLAADMFDTLLGIFQ